MEASKFRHLVKEVSGRDISTEQAEGFLSLFGEQVEAVQLEAIRTMVEHHFGKR